ASATSASLARLPPSARPDIATSPRLTLTGPNTLIRRPASAAASCGVTSPRQGPGAASDASPAITYTPPLHRRYAAALYSRLDNTRPAWSTDARIPKDFVQAHDRCGGDRRRGRPAALDGPLDHRRGSRGRPSRPRFRHRDRRSGPGNTGWSRG